MFFKSKKIIKIPGKSWFDKLTIEEVALMIEADSSLLPEGSDLFDSCALDEFLHCGTLKGREDLEKIREHILENIYLDNPNSSWKKINTDFLKQYAIELRTKHS